MLVHSPIQKYCELVMCHSDGVMCFTAADSSSWRSYSLRKGLQSKAVSVILDL